MPRGAEKKEKHAPSFSSPLLGQIMIKIQCGSSACFFSVQRIREENRERQILVPSKLCTLTGLVLLGVRGWAACMAGPAVLGSWSWPWPPCDERCRSQTMLVIGGLTGRGQQTIGSAWLPIGFTWIRSHLIWG
ncbi:hypothetical protein PVAP13_9NG309900 [Panicum virgatum]|uniref:Uncharacterized protein n=1 Tax=Panicum virgatum TaxID=38727 RepID=A0A8T0MJZ3_PANVG|nr:hypothetical protein PVAP13_9NG309900 [Panicum virgatum]